MLDFVKADLEEVEDNLIKHYRKSARPLNQKDINRFSSHVNVGELNTGILRSVTHMRKSEVKRKITRKIIDDDSDNSDLPDMNELCGDNEPLYTEVSGNG